MGTSIKIRRDTAARWAQNNPVPKEGELCIVTDTVPQGIKIGNGVTAFNSLPLYTLPVATQSRNGLMTATDKEKLDNIEEKALGHDSVLQLVGLAVGESVRVAFSFARDGMYRIIKPGAPLGYVNLAVEEGTGRVFSTDKLADEIQFSAGEYYIHYVFTAPHSIPETFFAELNNVAKIHIPSFVREVGRKAFYGVTPPSGSTGIQVDCEAMTPPRVDVDAFTNFPTRDSILKVHDIVKGSYVDSADWGRFGRIDSY